MKLTTDLHIHSHFSLATSRLLTPENLDAAARIKGINILGTGDFTHPGWISELKSELIEAEPGLYRLKRKPASENSPDLTHPVRFMLSSEISSIYKKKGRVRKFHSILLAPDFSAVEKINSQLSKIGNIHSDGRPILGLDPVELLKIATDASSDCLLIPAHIWTPWFSMLGEKSGFESISECFDSYADQISAVETGLSSDAPMNWLCSMLDRCTLLANSDAHSPDKIGRNFNIFSCNLSYHDIISCIRCSEISKKPVTVHLFPQEGKYHYAGHRNCSFSAGPSEYIRLAGICPVCKKPLTSGVLNRICSIADRDGKSGSDQKARFFNIIPLPEILAEISGTRPGSAKVKNLYQKTISDLGSEFSILCELPVSYIADSGHYLLSTAVKRMRERRITAIPGYDGEFGKISIFSDHEKELIRKGESHISSDDRPPLPELSFNFSELQNQNLLLQEDSAQKQIYLF